MSKFDDFLELTAQPLGKLSAQQVYDAANAALSEVIGERDHILTHLSEVAAENFGNVDYVELTEWLEERQWA